QSVCSLGVGPVCAEGCFDSSVGWKCARRTASAWGRRIFVDRCLSLKSSSRSAGRPHTSPFGFTSNRVISDLLSRACMLDEHRTLSGRKPYADPYSRRSCGVKMPEDRVLTVVGVNLCNFQ